jgi:AcrR family transcriptional regulator
MAQRSTTGADVGDTASCRKDAHLEAAAARVCARRAFLGSGGRLRPGELAARLGVSRATLFRRVGSRDELLAEVLWSLARGAVRSADRSTPGPPGPERVVSVAAAVAGSVGASEAFTAFVRREPERALRLLTEPDGVFDSRLRCEVELIVGRELSAEPSSPTSVRDLARLTVRVADSMVFADLLAGRPPDTARLAQSVAALLRPPDPPGQAEEDAAMRTTTRSDQPPLTGTRWAGERS